MSKTVARKLTDEQLTKYEQLAAALKKPEDERIVLTGQVNETLKSYVKTALTRMSKTELVNAALAALFEVQVYESVERQ